MMNDSSTNGDETLKLYLHKNEGSFVKDLCTLLSVVMIVGSFLILFFIIFL